jgi:hypothetical protein
MLLEEPWPARNLQMEAAQGTNMLKSTVVQFRVSAEEKTAWPEAAAAAKVPLSAWMRSRLQQALTQDTPSEPDPEPLNFLCQTCMRKGFPCCGACREMAQQNGL